MPGMTNKDDFLLTVKLINLCIIGVDPANSTFIFHAANNSANCRKMCETDMIINQNLRFPFYIGH